MSDFKELVKNLYTSKNRELTPEKFDYIQKTYSNGKEQDFVKNFYATIGEDLTEEKLTYISDTYLKKKDTPSAPLVTPSQLPKISEVSKEGNKKENAYFKQKFIGTRPTQSGFVTERVYENPMGVDVLQVEPKKREVAPTKPVQKAETKDKPLKGVKPIAPTKTELNEQGWLLNMVSALDKGVYKTLGTTAQGAGTLLQGVTSKITGGTGEGFISDALIKFGDSYNKMIDELTPQDESFKGSLSDQVGQALGFVGGLALTGGASSAAKGSSALMQQAPKSGALTNAVKELVKGTVSPTGVVGGLTMGQAEFDRAKQAGATDEQAFEAFYKNAAVGSVLERIPVMHFLKRFNQSTAGGVVNYIKTKGVAGLTGGVEEMTTEMLQQLYANKTAKDIYNANQDLFEGVAGNGTIGFSVGFLLNAMGANAKILRKEGKVNEAKLVENQVKELEEKSKGVAPTNNAITTKIAVNGNEEGLQRTQAELDRDLQNGVISEEEYQEKALVAQKAAEVNAKIPDYVQGVNRAESIDLINERENLQQELAQKEEQKKGIDVAYHKSIDESNKEVQKRIDEINNQLGELAKPEKNKVPKEEVIVEEEIQQPIEIEYKRLVEPTKPITEMNSEELYELAIQNRRALKEQDKEFFNKSEEEKEKGGYYNAIDDVEDLRDASERINFIENAENVDDLANSVKSILSKRKEGQPNEYELAILNAAKRKSVELGVEPKELIKSIVSKVANEYEDASDAELMVANVLEKLMPKQEQNIQPQIPNQPIEEQGEIVEAVRVEQEPIVGLNKDNKQPFTTKSKKQVVSFENGDLIVRDAKTGSEVSPKTKKKALREYAESFDFTVGEKAATPTEDMQFRDENELNQYIVDNSQNPSELVEVYVNQEPTTAPLSSIERMVADYGVGKVTNKSFERFGDRNLKGISMAKAYLNNQTGQSIDQVAKEMSDHYDVEITPQDIADFMVRFPNGEASALRLVESEVASNAAAKFKELTGLNLNQEIAQKVIEQQFNKLSKAEQLIAQQDYESATKLEEAYWADYKQTNGFTEEGNINQPQQEEARNGNEQPKEQVGGEPIAEAKEKLKPKEGHVYRAVDNADDAVGNDKSFSSKTNWYEGEGFLIEANNSDGKDIEHHKGAKRGNIKPEDVTTIYYDPNGIATDPKTFEREFAKMKQKFPNAEFVEIEYLEDEKGESQIYVKKQQTPIAEAKPKQEDVEDADIFYHSTNKNFEGFDDEKIGTNKDFGWFGLGHYFTSNKEESKYYGKNVIEINISKIKDKIYKVVLENQSIKIPKSVFDYIQKNLKNFKDYELGTYDNFKVDNLIDKEGSKVFSDAFKNEGYLGLRVSGDANELVIFESKNIPIPETKTPLEQQYEEANNKKGEKAKQKAKEKLISDNFDSIVAQLMTKNKIKRKC